MNCVFTVAQDAMNIVDSATLTSPTALVLRSRPSPTRYIEGIVPWHRLKLLEHVREFGK